MNLFALLLAPLISLQTATALRDAGFPQGNLHDRYYNGEFYVPAGTNRYAARSYYGTAPRPEWAYIPTSDELSVAVEGTVVLMRSVGSWTAIGETPDETPLFADGYSKAEALAKLWLLQQSR